MRVCGFEAESDSRGSCDGRGGGGGVERFVCMRVCMVRRRGIARGLTRRTGLLFVCAHFGHGLGGEGNSKEINFERIAVECEVDYAERMLGSS